MCAEESRTFGGGHGANRKMFSHRAHGFPPQASFGLPGQTICNGPEPTRGISQPGKGEMQGRPKPPPAFFTYLTANWKVIDVPSFRPIW
jgi:hypothetical protein